MPITFYYAFKQNENDSDNADAAASAGWQTMLSALIESGFSVSGTWPIRTEMMTRQVAMETNAIASSIVILFAISERKGWAREVQAYNILIISWPGIKDQARTLRSEMEQGSL